MAETKQVHPQTERLAKHLREWPAGYAMLTHDTNVCHAAADSLDAFREIGAELLAACKAVIHADDATYDQHVDGVECGRRWDAAIKATRDVMARIEGITPATPADGG